MQDDKFNEMVKFLEEEIYDEYWRNDSQLSRIKNLQEVLDELKRQHQLIEELKK